MQKQLNSNDFLSGAFILRSVAIFGILFQLDFISKDLSDTPIVVVTLICSIFAGFIMAQKQIKNILSVITLVLIPIAVHFIFASLHIFTFGNLNASMTVDSLLLNYDINNFVLYFPFCYSALSSFFSVKKVSALRYFILTDFLLIAIIFSITKSVDISFYRLPLVSFIVFAVLIFLEFASLILSVPKDAFIKSGEKARSFAILLLFVLVGGILVLLGSSDSKSLFGGLAGGKGGKGGDPLIQPKMFDFDVTPFLNLKTEVSMNNDLVFIVKKEQEMYNDHIYMRRFVLSQYKSVENKDAAAGFTRSNDIDEKNQMFVLPAGEFTFDNNNNYKSRSSLRQEYYIVNIDSAAFIAMNEPKKVIPFENYDSSSFKGVYAVESSVSNARAFDLYYAAERYKDDKYLGLSEDEFNWYTSFANDAFFGPTETEKKIKSLAEDLTKDDDNYILKATTLLKYFTEGDFRYSLKPGIAADGDQLAHFLFTSKKGYCSYFAFAFTSMLHSLNIPSRVAVGFFLDPESERFGFYPVISSMAHAWTEIWVPEYGWVEFDPTTDMLAEDEELSLSMGGQNNDFEQLMKEILENYDKLKAKDPVSDEDKDKTSLADKIKKAINTAKPLLVPIVLISILVCAILLRYKNCVLAAMSEDNRNKTIFLWKDVVLYLKIKGYKKEKGESEGEWISLLSANENISGREFLNLLYNNASSARYSPVYSNEEFDSFICEYKKFRKANRLLGKLKTKAVLFLILFCVNNEDVFTQSEYTSATELYEQAEKAVSSEYWERAVSLLSEGKQLYPQDYRFPMSLGEIYLSREFYNLAKEEFLLANKIFSDSDYILYQLARVTASLNEDAESAFYYEKILEIFPENVSVIDSLAWMYYKLHRLEDGEKLLLESIDEYGESAGTSMTLATIYSDMFNYEKAKEWYTKAIELANGSGFSTTASVAYYNFSILESTFFNYKNSFNFAENSLAMENRDSGHMALGELYLRCLDFAKTFSEYEKAYELDKRTPLAKLNLAETLLTSGRFEEALLYAEDCEKITNHSWMMNFGTDPIDYQAVLHEILYRIYLSLYNKEKAVVYSGIKDRWQGIIKSIQFNFKYNVHKKLFEKYSVLNARNYSVLNQDGLYLKSLKLYYSAFADYKNRALFYLKKAEAFETEKIPASESSYIFEKGKTNKNEGELELALSLFDNVWQRDMIADTYTEISKSASQNKTRGEAASSLYLLNPAALRAGLIRLPVIFDINAGSENENKKTAKFLKKSGLYEVKDGARFLLKVNAVETVLIDRANGKTLARKKFALKEFTAKELADFANSVSDAVFIVQS